MSRSKKPKPKNDMPSTTLAPLSTRKRRKKIQARVSAAVSMPEPLYLASLKQAEVKAGNNWSNYVRNLIHADLQSA